MTCAGCGKPTTPVKAVTCSGCGKLVCSDCERTCLGSQFVGCPACHDDQCRSAECWSLDRVLHPMSLPCFFVEVAPHA